MIQGIYLLHHCSQLLQATMQKQHIWGLLILAVLVSGIIADWEVLNDDGESRTDGDIDGFNLRQEYLLPVDAARKRDNKARQRSLSSLDQNGSETNHQTGLKVEVAHSQYPASIANADAKVIEGIKAMSLNPVSSSGTPDYSKSDSAKSDDVIDLAGEGLLSVENTNTQKLHNGRKLTQFKEEQSIEVVARTDQRPVSKDDLSLMSVQVACVYEDSWECLMFKEDLLAMQGDTNLSRRSSAHERTKRQSSSTYKHTETMKNIGNLRNLLACEECFSGDGNITEPGDIDEEPAEFFLKGKTKTRPPKNLTADQLTNDIRKELAKELEEELTKIFKDIPGFKNVTIDPNNIYFDTDGNLVYDNWVVTIDGGNGNYTGNNGTEVGSKVADALKDADGKYKNITLGGVSPIDNFNSTTAAKDVEKQANNSCETHPSPCKFGYGRCEVLPPDYTKNNGIRVRCIENCVNFSSVCTTNGGECAKDKAGEAFCNCSSTSVGLYCDKNPGDNKDEVVSPIYKLNFTAIYDTTLKPEDLTPEKRQQIAKQFIDQMNEIMKNVPGFTGVTVNPNDIFINKDGKLIIPWQMGISTAGPAFTGLTPEQIADLIKNSLHNVSGNYRNGALVDGQPPIEDLDFVDASEQVKDQAENPCSTNSCSIGYDHCQALSPTKIKCIHNCNTIPGKCKNDGVCQLDSIGKAICQCTTAWTGDNCETNVQSSSGSKLDGGQTAGVVIGAALICAGLLGALFWLLFLCRKNNNIEFTTYTDEEGSITNGGNSIFVIDRPQCTATSLPLFTQSGPNSRNFSRSSSYARSEVPSETPSEVPSETPSETPSPDPYAYSRA